MPKKGKAASKSWRNVAPCAIPSHGLTGDYYFVVKVVPVNSPTMPPGLSPRTLVTYHKVTGPSHAGSASKVYEFEAMKAGYESEKAFRFEVLDLNEKLESLSAAQCALATKDGQLWLKDAIDHVILKMKVS
jgi:hypothetical protein